MIRSFFHRRSPLFNPRPLVCLCIGFVAGVALSRFVIPGLWLIPFMICLALGAFVSRTFRFGFMLFATALAMCAGLLRGAALFNRLLPNVSGTYTLTGVG